MGSSREARATVDTQELIQSMSLEQLTAVAQILSAVATAVLAIAVFSQIRAAREQASATRETVNEMRQSRIDQDRPQVIVEVDLDRQPRLAYVVVRNIGKGGARDISFKFSASLESPESVDPNNTIVPVNEQPYFRRGLDFLAPGAEIPCLWGSMISLRPFLESRGLQNGVTVTSKYHSLSGDEYENDWVLNPLLVSSAPYVDDDDLERSK